MNRYRSERPRLQQAMSVLCAFALSICYATIATAQWKSVSLTSKIEHVQPWTGIVLWSDNPKNQSDAIQLEYSYMRYDDVAHREGSFDWSPVERLLDDVASRGHQAILRFYFVYPGKPTTVPPFIKSRSDYQETEGKSEGKLTAFPDWTNAALREFTLDFYTAFAKRFDRDPRLAYLQTGFGLWAEYHIYSGPREMGRTFPSKEFQRTFAHHLDQVFQQTPWMISVDAADNSYSPFEDDPELLSLRFGLFDDSFLCKPHPKENALNWRFFGANRWKQSPGGGEFSYYNRNDQRNALSEDGPNRQSFEDASQQFHITFMIGNDQPRYQSMDRIKSAGLATGYRFRIQRLEVSGSRARIEVTNEGVAPPYFDSYLVVDGKRAEDSLRGLLPGESRRIEVPFSGDRPSMSITSDRLVPGQKIEFAADLR